MDPTQGQPPPGAPSPAEFRQQLQRNQNSGAGCYACATVGFIVTAFLITACVLFVTRGKPEIGVFFGFPAVITLGFTLWAWVSAKQSDMLDCVIEFQPEDNVRFGERLQVKVTITAKSRCPLTSGTLALRCRERAINRGGTSDTTYTHLAYDEAVPVSANQELGEGMMWYHEHAFTIPPGLPASFSGHNNFIEWHVWLHLGVRGPALDVRRELAFTVLPESV